MDLKGIGGIAQELVAPLGVLGLAALVLGANLSGGLALQPLKHNHRFALRIPCALLHG
jgi:hypothetical protein